MRSPAIVGINSSPFGGDMTSISPLVASLCIPESDSSSEPEMERSGDKLVGNVDISLDKDSGVDSDTDFKVPDPALVENIVAQVESYFSDENLMKDEFVLKHIRRNKDGFISLKLLSSFRKVKSLTKDWKTVAYCVKMGSNKLELNESETKVRRKVPLPAVDGDKYSRTLIAYNLVNGTDDIDSISKVFSQFGEICLIRILKSGSSSVIPSNLLSKIKERYDLSQTSVATVEYYNKSGVDKAIAHFEKNFARNGTQIMPMKSSISRHRSSSNRWSECSSDSKESQRSFGKNKIDISLNIKQNKKPFLTRQKSKSCSVADETPKPVSTYVSKMKDCPKCVPIIRMPFGPDGTKGFNTHKNHRSRTM